MVQLDVDQRGLERDLLSTVLEPATGVVTGAEITFIGATPTSRSAPTVEIVPVTLAVVPGTAGSQP